MKIALISHRLPPSGAGQALVLYRMLQNLKPESYCLISPETPSGHGPEQPPTHKLEGTQYFLPPSFKINRGHRFGLRHLREAANIPLAVRHHARQITEIVQREQCGAVVACTGDVTHLPAGYLASRRANVPFYAYIFDHYVYREWQEPAAAFWAKRYEPIVMKRAAAVITPNEILRDVLRQRYGIEPVVIHNSFDISPYVANGQPPSSTQDGEIKIVYTGEIYEAHYDAFHNLVAAIKSLARPEIKLHVYSNRTTQDLEALGLSGPVVCHPQRPTNEIARIQMDADLLFLPLAFSSPYPELVRTSSTTKLGEYLAARSAILVHAPPDSFVSSYVRQHQCGFVVDEDEPRRLAEAINLALSNPELRRSMTTNAWKRAEADFDLNRSRQAFAQLVRLEDAREK